MCFQKLLELPGHAATRAISATSENTTDINPNFPRIHCDYLLITEGRIFTEFQNAHNYDNRWLSTSFPYSSKFARKFLSFTHFLKTLIHHSELFFLFSFSVWSFNSLISPSTISMPPFLQKNNFAIE